MKFEQSRISESLIQCELYHHCRQEGIDVYPEYSCTVNGKGCRFDLVILDDEEVVMIIECKSRESCKVPRRGKQYQKYKGTGLPVIYCVHLDMIEHTMTKIKLNLAHRRKKK